MIIQEKCSLMMAMTFVVIACILTSGCLTDVPLANNPYIEGESPDNYEEMTGPEDILMENISGMEYQDIYSFTYNTTLKRTGILELENNYSLKVLGIDKENERITVSLRKDDNEYASGIMLVASTYNIKDTKDLNVICSIHVDRILDNSFVVDLSYTIKPAITLEVEPYEGKARETDLKINGDTIIRTYRWDYENAKFTVEYEYNIETYDSYSERSRNRAYAHFVNDPYDDELISQITSQLGELAEDNGYSRAEIPYIAMTFVQSLPYVSDSASAGYDEYPRFPFETLYHGGGDCEDSSILLASLLYDMGYGVALIELPGHMAVGVKGSSDHQGNYYAYSGVRYYYLETTNSGWDVGVIPEQYVGMEATVVPVSEGYPELMIEFSGIGQSTGSVSYVDLDIEVVNVGSRVAEDVVIYATLETTTDGMGWDNLKTETAMDLSVDESLKYTVSDLHVPAGEKYRVGIWAWAENAETAYVYSDWTIA